MQYINLKIWLTFVKVYDKIKISKMTLFLL